VEQSGILMVSLTIQQRDLLHHLLAAEKPVVVADIANRMNLTPRQVSYRLKPLKVWLSQREATLKATPGIGITIDCPSEQRFNLLHELNSQVNFQLILTPGQRQQLFAFTLLTTKEPLILDGLGYIASISRTTVLKDLDVIEEWLQVFALTLIRRPNFGLFLEGPELAQRQALVSLLWEDVFFEDSLIKMTYDQGLIFSFSDNTALPILKQTNALLKDWNTPAALEWVTYAEAQLGGRFTDDAVLHLALAFLIQRHRVAQGQYIQSNPKGLSWLVNQKVWPVALEIAYIGRMGPNITEEEFQPEVAYIAMHLLAGLRDHMWPGDLDIDPNLT
jgi:transcriptional antiterminator